MPIRFACHHCHSPIEVDDEYANQVATCPFCRTVVRVPAESTLDLTEPVPARPVPPPVPEDEAVWNAAPAEGARYTPDTVEAEYRDSVRRDRALNWARPALVLSVLGLCLLLTFMVGAMIAVQDHMDEFEPTPEGQQAFNEALMEELLQLSWPLFALLGAVLLGLLAAILSTVSLRISRTWQGVTAAILGWPIVVCLCLDLLIGLVRAPFGG